VEYEQFPDDTDLKSTPGGEEARREYIKATIEAVAGANTAG
jgi:hypothetical protein